VTLVSIDAELISNFCEVNFTNHIITSLEFYVLAVCVLVNAVDDDCTPPVGTDMGIVPVMSSGVDTYSSNLFIAALVDHLCSLYVPNSTKKDKLFQSKLFCSCNVFALVALSADGFLYE